MAQTYDVVETSGTTKTTSKYTCESKDLQYTIIGDNIKSDFDFLINEIPDKLDAVLSELSNASANINAFQFSNESSVKDISEAYDEIKNDIDLLKNGLSTLHSAFMTDIDNVNAELENNFGYWAFNKPNLAGKVVETISTASSESNNN